MSREMKDSGLEWVAEIPATWMTGRLKNYFSFGKGLPITKDNLVEAGIPVISYGQIHSKQNTGTGLNDALFRYVNEDFLSTNPNSLVKKGDFIFADTSEDHDGCGNCVYVDSNQTLFAGYHTIILSGNESTDNRYLAYLFKTDAWRNQIRSKVFGIKVYSVTKKILSETTIICPPPCDQKKIADYLDDQCSVLDSVLTRTRASIEEYKKLKQAAITQAVTKGIHKGVEMASSKREWIRAYPKHWKEIRIKWLLDERKEHSTEGKEEPLSMSQKYGLIPTKEMDMVPNIAASFVGAKLAYKGDLVFNKLKAHLGVFAVSAYDGLVSPDYAVYYATGLANMKYLEYLFKTPQYIAEFKKKSTGVGAGLTRLYTAGLYSIYCALPPIDEQKEIAEYLDRTCSEIDTLIAKKEQYLVELENYKKSLIYEYVTGKKEVR